MLQDINIIHVVYPGTCHHLYAKHIKTMPSNASTEAILSRIFSEWFHGSGNECKEFLNSKQRSMQSGDIIGINQDWFQLHGFGFTPVSKHFVDSIEGKQRASIGSELAVMYSIPK